MPAFTLLCFVDRLEIEFVSQVGTCLQKAVSPRGWIVDMRPAAQLTLAGRMDLIVREAKQLRGKGVAAYAHLQLSLDQAAVFHAQGVPLGYLCSDLEGVDCVMDDGKEGTQQAASHLLGLGHRRIAHLMGSAGASEAVERKAGFDKALRVQGLVADEALLRHCPQGMAEEGKAWALELLRSPDPPSAIVCSAGDLVASGVYEAAKELALRIPQDLSIVGYDDLPLASKLDPPLDTIRQPLEEMTRLLVKKLFAAMDEGESHKPSLELVHPNLVVRQSTAAPRH